MAWALAGLLILVLLLAGGRSLQQQRAAKALPAAAAVPTAELAATDVLSVQPRALQLGLAISGTLKAVDSAMVKARVAGELQGLVVREGDTVRAGQVLGQIDPSEYRARLQQAQQQAEAARAQLDIAQRQFDNNQALVAQNFISRSALETSQANLQAAQASHRAALATADVARKALEDTVLRAPLAGQVSQRLAQPGERLSVDARVLEIVDPRRLELEAAVGAAESLRLQIGQRAELRLEGSARPLAARLVRINPSAQVASRTVLAYLSLEPSGEALRQGLFAQGTLGTGRREVPVVPVSAVRLDKAQPYVQIVRQGQVAHQGVTLGERGTVDDEEMVEVDLPVGTQVLRASVGPLREGLALRWTTPSAGEPALPARTTP